VLRLNLAGLLYLVAGVVLAAGRHYLTNLDTIKRIGSAVLAVLLWPLLLLGIDLHIR